MNLLQSYYLLKPLIPRRVQLFLRRRLVSLRRRRSGDRWPIDGRAGAAPPGWGGWPQGKGFAVVLTHDVETAEGQARCRELAELERSLGFRSSFNFVPERYRVDPELRRWLGENGFEVGVHGLTHDGKYFSSPGVFRERALRINRYLKEWGAEGFRAPSMLHDLDALHQLDILYDASTFDTDPFEPQADGVGTIFPFVVKGPPGRPGYVELPYTLPQDFTLFCLMGEKGIGIWKQKLAWVAERGGMAMVIVHPDYIDFGPGGSRTDRYPVSRYADLLQHIRSTYQGRYLQPLPREVARLIRAREGKP